MPVDPSAVKTWANLVTVARLLIAPFMFVLIPDHPGGSWPAFVFACWMALRREQSPTGTPHAPPPVSSLVLSTENCVADAFAHSNAHMAAPSAAPLLELDMCGLCTVRARGSTRRYDRILGSCVGSAYMPGQPWSTASERSS